MIADATLLSIRSGFPRPTAAQAASFRGVPTGFVCDVVDGRGGMETAWRSCDEQIDDVIASLDAVHVAEIKLEAKVKAGFSEQSKIIAMLADGGAVIER